jgi:prephenate dehydratase
VKKRIAFQGELGAFSQIAADRLAGGEYTPCPIEKFEDVFLAVVKGKCHAAVIPIENTLHGSVHENYDHLLKYELQIRGETFVRIVHNLIAPPGMKFSAITHVYSHPVALNQCRRFFEENPQIERTPFYDTAGSVKMIMRDKPPGGAAIASAAAAEIYGGKILRRSIEDDRENFTRFFLLEKHGKRATPQKASTVYKTSIVFTTRNTPGSLFRAMSAFALRDLSLTKIESRPLRGKPWEYLFYLDFLGHAEDAAARHALGHLAEQADMLRVLGCYPAAK